MKVQSSFLDFLKTLVLCVGCAYATDASAQTSCVNSPDDELIVEYFNEVSFNEDVLINVADLGSSFQVVLSCPPPVSSDIPPSDFRLRLNASDGSQYSECGSTAPVSINKAKLTANQVGFCSDKGSCRFAAVLDNRSSRTVYSETVLDVIFRNDQTIASPLQLTPATVQVCDDSLDNCLMGSECSVSTSEIGVLSLCDSSNAASCASPPNISQYSANINPYYKLP